MALVYSCWSHTDTPSYEISTNNRSPDSTLDKNLNLVFGHNRRTGTDVWTNPNTLCPWRAKTAGGIKKTLEPQHDKTNKMTCAPSKDSDQSGPTQSDQSLECTQWVASQAFSMWTAKRLIRLGGCLG